MTLERRVAAAFFAVLLSLCLGLLPPAAARAEPARYVTDPDHAVVAFLVSHIGYEKVLGRFTGVTGSYLFDEAAPSLSDLEVTIAAASVDTRHRDRDGHLRSGDFLAAEAHPDIRFVMTSAEPTGARTGLVTGDLTLRGVTRPVTLEVTWNKTGAYPFGNSYVTGISARTRFKRSDFGMTYGVADGLVGDEVEVIIEVEAIRQ
ncbi:Polyisoprenoid-binding protein YceI [Tistlia consotensis]|uniref:Polyisoprenoid-binding protein YceI n=1 Tax=Tistlia consotensis USBA 355 TaxID=560819 RepID=A0A1Y6BNI5_9PROT|nr:YceI family protein [Tistlia consotensis]SMF11968.1 Polyisoprenoid-binding protein YceI [Tistlia consotensis USBA 355]SNR51481.1 Polyisoprenoid-binding protein YceI [Tistlia consotensis]